MKAIGYVRCSTQEQADSGLGLDTQTERTRAYCATRKLDLVDVIVDAGVSGGKPSASREGGKRLLGTLRKGGADAMVMLKLDRMFRNAGDCLSTVEKWERPGVALHVVDLGGKRSIRPRPPVGPCSCSWPRLRKWNGTLPGNGPDQPWPPRRPSGNGWERFPRGDAWLCATVIRYIRGCVLAVSVLVRR